MFVRWEVGCLEPPQPGAPTTRGLLRTDLDRRPGAVRFDGFVFAPGSAHEFRVTAQYQGASSAGVPSRGGKGRRMPIGIGFGG